MPKIRFYFLIIVLFISLESAFLPAANVFGMQLNLEYPNTPTGSTITGNSSVPQYLKYIFNMGLFVGGIALIVSLAIAGVFYFLSPVVPGALEKAKDRIFGSLSGFLILLLVYLIATTINPDLSIFKSSPLTPNNTSSIPPAPPTPGVYFYQTKDCSKPPDPLIKTRSVYNLEDKKRNTKSAKIIQDPSGDAYISILFESPKYTGRCFYLDPNKSCNNNIDPFASAASIYKYNFYPSGGSITFFREPFYNANGGYLQVSGAETSNNKYFKALKDLNYMKSPGGNLYNPDDCTVPKEKMDCVAWDDSGACKKRKCPNLAERNISSIQINGNYVVLLAFIDPNTENARTSWSLCQSFPSIDDNMRMGPNKVVWEDILNQNRIPNYVVIFPVIDNSNPDKKGLSL